MIEAQLRTPILEGEILEMSCRALSLERDIGLDFPASLLRAPRQRPR